jgi:hypothetical protein
LDGAEKLYLDALEIDKMLSRLEGQANQLGNLGRIAKQRGRIAQARQLWTESRGLFARIGMPHKVEEVEDWLVELSPER